MNFCGYDNKKICSTPTKQYIICYECEVQPKGTPCIPEECCDHEDFITIKTDIPLSDTEFEIDPESSYIPDVVDIRQKYWNYVDGWFSTCEPYFRYSLKEADPNSIVTIQDTSLGTIHLDYTDVTFKTPLIFEATVSSDPCTFCLNPVVP